MVFSSFEFMLLFLPLTLLGFHLSGLRGRKYFLIAASLFFYGCYNWRHLALLLCSLLLNYGLARLMVSQAKPGRRLCFIVAITVNVLLLGYYKYANFFLENLNALTGLERSLGQVALPLGISFFTFQQISFQLALYKEELTDYSFSDYCLYLCFFPKLSMGPLAEPEDFIRQIQTPGRLALKAENLAPALYLFAMGLFKKAVIADSLALFANNGYALAAPGLAASWAASLSYTMQLYFDFSGYSDMALALGLMFNIRLPVNFDSPYKAASIGEFWRRWHMSLGRALGRFIYRPLGGSRHGLGRTCLNLMATFLVSGLWHGAAWTFVLWGALHGLIAALERICEPLLRRIPRPVRIACTFLAVNFLWVLFRAESFSQAMDIYRGMLDFGNIALAQLQTLAFDGNVNYPGIFDYALVLGSLLITGIMAFCSKNTNQRMEGFAPTLGRLILAALMLAVSMLCMTRESIFIYFNF